MTLIRSLLVLFLLILGRCASDVPGALAPDMVLHNGKIVTVDQDFSIAQAMAIKEGRFVAVGSDAQILALAGAQTEIVDLEGKTVLPGFHDSHVHLAHRVAEPPEPLIQKLGEAKSIAEIVEVVRQKVAATPPRELVWIPRGPRIEQIEEKGWPTRHDLDPVSPENPVIVAFGGDQAIVANSLALAAAKIDGNTPQPYKEGLFGEFHMDPRTGQPTGVATGFTAFHILREGEGLNVWPTEKLEKNIARALKMEILPAGITSLSDPLTSSENQPTQHAYQRLANSKEGLPVRINLMVRIPVRAFSTQDCLDLIDNLLFTPPFRSHFLRVGTFKLSLDKGRSGEKPYVVPAEKGTKVLLDGHQKGWQLYVHIRAPEAFDYASQALEEAFRLYPRQDARHVFTHIPYPTQENLEIMKRLGIIADLQVGAIYHLADDAKENYPVNPERPDLGPMPVATYRDAGIPVILSSDNSPIGPLFAVWEAVNRVRKSGKVFQPQERLTLEEAIRAITITSAWAFFQDDVKGSIEAGKYADLVVLGGDILSVDPLGIKDIPVLMTMTHGKFVYLNPNQDPMQKVDYLRYPVRTSFLN
ncbi:amidohydrolase [Acidobacteria bacterium AH-259-D05]|nr:amidohydrolase [Acidobacteria bacterium AH-259-D05]